MPFPPGVGARGVCRVSDMPFPSGVGGGGGSKHRLVTDPSCAVMGGAESGSFEVITAERALDASNVGNRMLRNMGWQEGSVCEESLASFTCFVFLMLSTRSSPFQVFVF